MPAMAVVEPSLKIEEYLYFPFLNKAPAQQPKSEQLKKNPIKKQLKKDNVRAKTGKT